MTDEEQFTELVEQSLVPSARQPPEERVKALRLAAQAAAAQPDPVAVTHLETRRAGPLRRAVAGLCAVAALLIAFAGGQLFAPTEIRIVEAPPEGVVEFRTTLAASSGQASASVVGRKTGIGRIVELRSDSLPILPKGELYEVWFVGPGDAPDSPNRISAGTFHPDEQGRTAVVLTAAVDPAKYGVLSVTAEPGDGRPEPAGPEVLRADLEVIS